MSLDGFITGPGPDLEHGLGRGGEAIPQWVFASHDSPRDRAILESADQSTGAVVMGRRTFDFIEDRKSTRLNSSHVANSYAVFCLIKKIHHTPERCSLPSETTLQLIRDNERLHRSWYSAPGDRLDDSFISELVRAIRSGSHHTAEA